MTRFDEQLFVSRIRRRLDGGLEHLDDKTMARLDAARDRALAQADTVATVSAALTPQTALPAEIESRLDAIRRQAVSRLREPESGTAIRRPWYALANLFHDRPWATGMVMAAFVAVTTTSLLLLDRPADSLSLEEELTLVTSAEDIELYENLEFYLWLTENGLPN